MWDKLKGAIFTDEPGKPGQAKPPVAPPQQQQAPTAVRGGGIPQGNQPAWQPQPLVNEEMVKVLRAATFSRNTALTALIAASDTLTDVIPDPTMRIKAAYKMAGQGRSTQDMAGAVQIHLNDVDGEELRFTQALQKKSDMEIGGIKRQADGLEQGAGAKEQEIQNLQQRIQQLGQELNSDRQKVDDLRRDAAQREAEFAHSAEEFKIAANVVRAELNAHRTTILSTLS